VPGINPYSANVENMVSSKLGQKLAGGNLLGFQMPKELKSLKSLKELLLMQAEKFSSWH